MSNSTRKPYRHYACFDNKTQRFYRNKSRRTIRRKSRIALRRCLTEPDIDSVDYVYRAGASFKDGFDEWTLPLMDIKYTLGLAGAEDGCQTKRKKKLEREL